MLDSFEILTTSGVVVWSRTYSPINPSIINNFIADTFIEEKGGFAAVADSKSASNNPPYKSDQHTLKWTLVKELGVIFVVSTPGPHSARSSALTYPLFPRPSTDRCFTSHGSINSSTISGLFLSSSMANNS